MKFSFLFLCLLVNLSFTQSQVSHLETFFKKTGKEPKIYAIIVGISDYKDPQIPDLRFADRDAEIFYEYLKSKAGGSVPPPQIKFFKGSDATVANVYNALSWVQNQVIEGDKFYFYFAGHGDLESSLYKLGFLLTYDTPFQNYINNAIRIEDLNNIANTLSVDKKVNTILITDACHSGKLAGTDNRGPSLVGSQLSLVQKNEIRFTSCESDQKSQENTIWGGGRGVFSYYLVNGMKGLADDDKDDKVTLQELKTYLENNVSKDVINLNQEEQNPIISGKPLTVISKVTDHSIDSMSAPKLIAANIQMTSRDASDHDTENMDLISEYFKIKKSIVLKDNFDFSKIISSPIEAIPDLIFKELQPTNSNMDSSLNIALKDPDERIKFNLSFAAMIHDQVQEAINLYLNVDETELEKREYYNSESSNYDQYPIMIQTALNLIDKNHYLYHILQVKLHYFKGIAARVNMPISEKPDSLLNIAFSEQVQALALEDQAAYINNELGLLFAYKSLPDLAEKYYQKAITLSPTWAIPRSNLSALFAAQKKYNEGIKSALDAIALKPKFSKAILNLGINYEGAGNWLFAEEQFRKNLELNSKHYLSFDKLGLLYLHNLKYAIADSFFREENLRLIGFESMPNFPMDAALSLSNNTGRPIIEKTLTCDLESTKISKQDIMAPFDLAMRYFDVKNYSEAKKYLINLSKKDPSNPLLFRYLAEIYYLEQNWLEAEINFKYADQNYLDQNTFLEYCNKIKPNQKMISDCIEEEYKAKYFNKNELIYFFAKLYESWGHFEEAHIYYNKIIQANPSNMAGYYLLWTMKEKLGKYEECEELIRNFGIQNKTQSERELLAYYTRRQNANNSDFQYYNKSANLLYNLCKGLPPGNELNPNPEQSLVDNNSNRANWIEEEPAADNAIPGIHERLNRAAAITNPRILGISMFENVCKLTKDTFILADAHEKAGDLYLGAGDKQSAFNQYQISLELSPGNANIRMKIIDFCNEMYFFEQGLKNLNDLAQLNQINYEKMLQLADYNIRQSKFVEANKILNSMQSILPVQKNEITALKAKSALFSNQLKIANKYYLDEAIRNQKNPESDYTAARIYAMINDKNNAFKMLKKSIQNGFNFSEVLKKDPAWTLLRKSKDWKELVPEPIN